MSTWYEKAVFYHMYPLGMTGAPKQNTGTEQTDRFDELELWIPHIKALGCNAIYIGPFLNPPAMAMIPEITNRPTASGLQRRLPSFHFPLP